MERPAIAHAIRHAASARRRFQCAALLGLLALGAASSEAQPTVRQVLLLQSFDRGNIVIDSFTGHLRVELDQRSGTPVNVVQVVVGPTGFVGAPEREVVDYIRSIFVDRPKPDLIMTTRRACGCIRASSTDGRLFPETPLLFGAVDQRYLRDAPLGENETAVAVVNDYPRLIDEILQLLPQTRQVFMVMGSGSLSKFWRRELNEEFKRFHDRLTFVWSEELSLSEILRRSANLPRDSAIFYPHLWHRRAGRGVCGRASARRPCRHRERSPVRSAERVLRFWRCRRIDDVH